MGNRTKRKFLNAALLAGALAVSHAASAGRVVLDHDEWTLTDFGFSQAMSSTSAYAANLATFMNIDGGACNLLVYSANFGLTGSSLGAALTGAGCAVTYSTGAFDLPTLSAFDGVLLGARPYAYDAATLTAYVNSGHSAYVTGGTGYANEDTMWDSFVHGFGLDFGPSYNNITGKLNVAGPDPLLAGVQQLYFNNGNTVSLHGAAPYSRLVAVQEGTGAGLIGVYDGPDARANPQLAVPEPATLGLLGAGLAGLGFARRRRD